MRDAWNRILHRSWAGLVGRPPADLSDDLEALTPFFATGVKVKAIKDRLSQLPPADQETGRLPAEVLMAVDGCALITPEGRILLDVLTTLARVDSNVIDTELQLSALDQSVGLRSRWHRVWLQKQFEGTLSPAPIGAGIFLLINGSIGESNAFLMPKDGQLDREVGDLVLPLLANFSRHLGGRVPETTRGVQKHWAFTQVSRFLSRYVARDGHEDETLMYVRQGQERALLDVLAKRLAKAAPVERRWVAVDEFVADYRSVRGALSLRGLMHEDPTSTRRIVGRLTSPELEL
jgi:hypothetical protein